VELVETGAGAVVIMVAGADAAATCAGTVGWREEVPLNLGSAVGALELVEARICGA
jgi:hypothetical protein